MSRSYYEGNICSFLIQSTDEIIGQMTNAHHFDLDQKQRDAWISQINILKLQLEKLDTGKIYFEFSIPRMGKRIDTIILYKNVIFAIEFKVGSDKFDNHAIEQVYDYALDLKNFHKGSHNAAIIPILIATDALSTSYAISFAEDLVAEPICIDENTVYNLITDMKAQSNQSVLDQEIWAKSGYLPTPTIIEAARSLYQNHHVTEIARTDAGAINLALTHSRVNEIIEEAKQNSHKAICFITGVPGAGKTLVGLNISTCRSMEHSEEHAVFLSGNGPLVSVLREALTRDELAQNGGKKTDASRKVNSFIQNIHHFRDEYLKIDKAPIEKVVIFDEAQRAWTKDQASKFMKRKRGFDNFNQSESEFLINVMDRHSDWCVIICLIGGGQEINTGEAGLKEWLIALKEHFPEWKIHASSLLSKSDYTTDDVTRNMIEDSKIIKYPDLHLSVSMRSFRAEKLNNFVNALIDGNSKKAQDAYKIIYERYPIYLTRDLETARNWLRNKARGSERYGIVSSSGALRLRPAGLHVKTGIKAEKWFLNNRYDIRSSFYLEEVATEFDIQGLELDWTCVAWDADLRWLNNQWNMHNFRGTSWQKVHQEDRKQYLLNAYRVLLTRARQGMVIYIPNGNQNDYTRISEFYDGTYDMLRLSGAIPLGNIK